MEKITSRENAKVKYACRLASSGAFRRAEGRFLAEGRKLCPELCRGAELETLFCTESALEKCPELSELPGEHYLVEDHVADKLADVGTHQGVFGVFRTPVHPLEEVKTGGRYLALERVQDPGNVGTLLRSAAAFGFDGVLLSDGCASVFAPKTLRASMGAAVRIPVIEAGKMPEAIALLREKGITCLAAALYQSQPLSAAASGYPDGVCVVIGSEGQGLTDETIAACTGTVRIPMTDRVESLNAGIAGSILLWNDGAVRVRGGGGGGCCAFPRPPRPPTRSCAGSGWRGRWARAVSGPEPCWTPSAGRRRHGRPGTPMPSPPLPDLPPSSAPACRITPPSTTGPLRGGARPGASASCPMTTRTIRWPSPASPICRWCSTAPATPAGSMSLPPWEW